MYRLGELSDARRTSIGRRLLTLGLLGLALGVVWIHWSSLPMTELVDGVEVPVVVDQLNWWPRGIMWKGAGYLVVGGAVTLLLIGASFLWVLNQKMTWARATVASIIAWVALVFYFGMAPSEWLNFAQTDLEWGNNIAFALPTWLMLGNTVEISYAVIKDVISGGYHIAALAGAAALAVQIQKIKEGRPPEAVAEAPRSPYGRPLVKGGR